MNLPNKITLARVLMIPVFLVVYMLKPFGEEASLWVALAIFAVASISDAVDGYLARRYGLVTNFGKLMDPLADKLLVCAALVAFVASGTIPGWAAIIFISREFFVSGLRQLALEQRAVLAASVGGKIKTVFQMILIHFVLIPIPAFIADAYPVVLEARDIMVWVLLILSVIASVLSGLDYGYKNWGLLHYKNAEKNK
ncbi:MAG: CDP-diacylglycerol--glycerol-3-phosphate 3-phosphatidyltransferase [Defluviitaleaceae bacterium]|nr:CDP-diacylglycerol--glycerol-3-phosphate 3-phosphatidyltransferase [Defluviitaleaceae bacterium]MCL2274845.1 CDP-diacylglycerol--glycerol-3-phosphate 3-phosphatidyltransferase [Defluviitaleaceae bacterium]